MAEVQLLIQYPPDLDLLSEVAGAGVLVASETTARFSSLDALVEMGLLSKVYCHEAGKIYQFNVSLAGLEVLQ